MKKTLRLMLLSTLMLFTGQAFAENIIWSEDWSGVNEFKVDPSNINSNYTFTGTTYKDDGISYKGGTAVYNENLAGGDAPELLVAKSGGSFAAKVSLNGASGDMTLAFKCNKNISVTIEGATLGVAENVGFDYSYPVTVAAGTSEITITFTMEQTSNARLDNIKLYQGTAKKPAGLSWGKGSTTLYLNQEVTLTLSNENNLPVTYTSSDESVATISSEGVITLVAVGKTTLTAAFEGNSEYEAQSVSIEVTVKEEGGDTPGPSTVTEVTVAQALEVIDALEDNAKTTAQYKVTGYVVEVVEISTQHGNATFTLADAQGGSPVLTFYRGKGFNGADITDENIVKVNDKVEVQGLLQKYVKEGVTTPEVAQGGKIVSINGNTGSDTPIETTKAGSIKEFVALANNTVAELTLNNAIVSYKNVNGNNTELFITDGTGALDLYNMGITAEAGQVLSGTIIGTRGANNGFTAAMKVSENTNVSTVSVGGTQTVTPVEIGPDEVNVDYVCQLVKIVNATISEDGKKCSADGAELALYDRFKLNLTNGLDTSKEYDITGLVYDGGTTYGMELVVTAITLAGGGTIVSDPVTPVESIEALLALGDKKNVELTLTNAKVLFNDGNNIYVRENGKALCFYQINGLKEVAKNNTIINGKIIGNYEVFNLMPELKSHQDTNLDGLDFEESEEEAVPVQTTLAAVANGDNVCDLVTLTAKLVREVTYKEDGETVSSTKYYLEDGDVKLVVVNNSKNLRALADEGVENIIVTGVVNTASGAFQIKLTKNAENAAAGLKGDVNGDNVVDVADITAVISVMASGSNDPKADVNGDNMVDVADITAIISIMAN